MDSADHIKLGRRQVVLIRHAESEENVNEVKSLKVVKKLVRSSN
jgi:hypothetical protein